MSDDYGRRAYGDDGPRDPWLGADEEDAPGDRWARDDEGGRGSDRWGEPEEGDRTSDRWRDAEDASRREAWASDAGGSEWPAESERSRVETWRDRDDESETGTRGWRAGRSDDLDGGDYERDERLGYGRDDLERNGLAREERDRDDYERSDVDRPDYDRPDYDRPAFDREGDVADWEGAAPTAIVEEPPRTPEEREQEALRSFVESEALPSPERMAAAELEAEREAARDAAAAAISEPELAESRRGRFGERTVDGRLARMHLRGGLIPLARAELETMAGQVTLDLEALADLAEARWRSGDLLGAGEAAQAHLSRGGDEVTALVVAVEALTAQGRTIDARRLAAEVLDRTGGELDAIFAGQSRAHLWSRPADLRSADTDGETEPGADAQERALAEEPAAESRRDSELDGAEDEAAIALAAPDETRFLDEARSAEEEPEESPWAETRAAAPGSQGAEFGVVSSASRGRAEVTDRDDAEETAAWRTADLDRATEDATWPRPAPGSDEAAIPPEADVFPPQDQPGAAEPGVTGPETVVTGAETVVTGEERAPGETLVTASDAVERPEESVSRGEPVEAQEEPFGVGEPAEPEDRPATALEPEPAAVPEPAAAVRDESAGQPLAAAPSRRMPALGSRRELRSIEEAIDEGRLDSVPGRLALLLRMDPDAAARIVDVALDAIAVVGPGTAETANMEIVRGDALRVLGRAEEAEAAYAASRRALEPGRSEVGEADATNQSSYAGEIVEPTDELAPEPAPEPVAPADEWAASADPATGEEPVPMSYEESPFTQPAESESGYVEPVEETAAGYPAGEGASAGEYAEGAEGTEGTLAEPDVAQPDFPPPDGAEPSADETFIAEPRAEDGFSGEPGASERPIDEAVVESDGSWGAGDDTGEHPEAHGEEHRE